MDKDPILLIAEELMQGALTMYSETVEKNLVALEDDFKFEHLLLRNVVENDVLDTGACELALEAIWERLHIGAWHEVDQVWRDAYAVVGALKASSILFRLEACEKMMSINSREVQTCQLLDALHCIDQALLMHGRNPMLCRAASEIHKLCPPYVCKSLENENVALSFIRTDSNCQSYKESSNIKRIHAPTLNWFLNCGMKSAEPFIVTGAMEEWPAMKKWSKPDYFLKLAGHRRVPVEFGNNYMSKSWNQKVIPFGDFVCNHTIKKRDDFCDSVDAGEDQPRKRYRKNIDRLSNDNDTQSYLKKDMDWEKKVGYLAQHELLVQIPQLENDIIIPDYCSLKPAESATESNGEVAVNFWFGPPGTVSPLHHDPKNNLLAQVIGSKLIKLASPQQNENVYPNPGMMSNTSQIDVEHEQLVDLEKFPKFKNAKLEQVVLNAGEMLYIPPKHWHFVKSLDTSISLSFWW